VKFRDVDPLVMLYSSFRDENAPSNGATLAAVALTDVEFVAQELDCTVLELMELDELLALVDMIELLDDLVEDSVLDSRDEVVDETAVELAKLLEAAEEFVVVSFALEEELETPALAGRVERVEEAAEPGPDTSSYAPKPITTATTMAIAATPAGDTAFLSRAKGAFAAPTIFRRQESAIHARTASSPSKNHSNPKYISD